MGDALRDIGDVSFALGGDAVRRGFDLGNRRFRRVGLVNVRQRPAAFALWSDDCVTFRRRKQAVER
jgi:hypothetical protein